MKPSTIIMTYGRFQPCTIGHIALFNAMSEYKATTGCDATIIVSKTLNCTNNPLTWEEKSDIISLCTNIHIADKDLHTSPYSAVEYYAEKYDKVIFVCGGDRLISFSNMEKYCRDKGAEFELMSAGNRLSDELVSSASSTILRKAAMENDIHTFNKYFPRPEISASVMQTLRERINYTGDATIEGNRSKRKHKTVS